MTTDDIVKIINDAAQQAFLNAVKESVTRAEPDSRADYSVSLNGENIVVSVSRVSGDNGVAS